MLVQRVFSSRIATLVARFESAVDEPARRASPVRVDTHQQSAMPGRGFIMRERVRFQLIGDALAAIGRIDRFKTFRQRMDRIGLAQSQNCAALQRGLDGGPKPARNS